MAFESKYEPCPKGTMYPIRKRRIVCAANRGLDGTLLLGVRHWDMLMRAQFEVIGKVKPASTEWAAWEQGFVDNKGEFLTRTEAWHIAHEANQIIRRVGADHIDGGTLFSENLY